MVVLNLPAIFPCRLILAIPDIQSSQSISSDVQQVGVAVGEWIGYRALRVNNYLKYLKFLRKPTFQKPT